MSFIKVFVSFERRRSFFAEVITLRTEELMPNILFCHNFITWRQLSPLLFLLEGDVSEKFAENSKTVKTGTFSRDEKVRKNFLEIFFYVFRAFGCTGIVGTYGIVSYSNTIPSRVQIRMYKNKQAIVK